MQARARRRWSPTAEEDAFAAPARSPADAGSASGGYVVGITTVLAAICLLVLGALGPSALLAPAAALALAGLASALAT